MEIVIEIPEDAYRQIRNWGVPTDELRRKIYDIIDKGTPLPEHHGRLIDADALMKLYGLEDATKYGNETAEQQTHSYDTMMMYEIADMLDNAPTIIEADKGVLEKINEKQSSLRATCKAWKEAISRDGYVN